MKTKKERKVELDNWKDKEAKKKFEKNEIPEGKIKKRLGVVYEQLLKVIREYCDLREEYYPLTAIWVIGTYLHDSFNTYPYLFVNAMKGSGKTRFLKLISNLAQEGELLGSLTEAVLFRIPEGNTICIDEFEGITRKGKEGLRELLNAGYKRGLKIRRMKQVTTPDGKEMVAESFEPYKPICLANIWGMEEVLGDRCITIIVEKSKRKDIMMLVEDFETNEDIKKIKCTFSEIKCSLCGYFVKKRYIKEWNKYVKDRYNDTNIHTTYTTLTTLHSHTTPVTQGFLDLFNKIAKTGVDGRNLELFLPLFLIADYINEEVLDVVLGIASKLTKERREDEMTESKDVALIDFVSRQEDLGDFRAVNRITADFRAFLGEEEKDERWLNAKWVGRALKRLNLIVDKTRRSEGIRVTLNVKKAKERIRMFGTGEKKVDENSRS